VKAAVGEVRQPKYNTISHLQPVKTLQQWADKVGEDVLFSVCSDYDLCHSA